MTGIELLTKLYEDLGSEDKLKFRNAPIYCSVGSGDILKEIRYIEQDTNKFPSAHPFVIELVFE